MCPEIIIPYGGKLWQRENLANSLCEHIGGGKFGELPYGGKLWQQENLANSLREHIGGGKFGEL